MNLERILFSSRDGCLSSFIPQYIAKGNEIIPVQVIRVPKGIDSSLSNANESNEDPITKSMITIKVKIRAV